MQQLLQRIEQIKAEKLLAVEAELAQQEQEELAALNTQLAELQKTLQQKQAVATQQAQSKARYEHGMRVRFALQHHQQQLLEKKWQETVDAFFSESKNLNAWLATQLEVVFAEYSQKEGGLAGTLHAGASYAAVVKCVLPKTVTLSKDTALSSEPGFIYTTAAHSHDCRLSVFLSELYAANTLDLYRIAFQDGTDDGV